MTRALAVLDAFVAFAEREKLSPQSVVDKYTEKHEDFDMELFLEAEC